jgi:hypothetical protein
VLLALSTLRDRAEHLRVLRETSTLECFE